MLADLDETIRQLMIRHVPLDLAEVDVSFDAPDREWSGRLTRPTVNCFLYDVRENLELRQTDWEFTRDPANGSLVRRKGPARINATYNVTVWARAAEDEHRLLWRVLSALARHPTLPEEVGVGDVRDQAAPVTTKVAQPDPGRATPADLWQALDNRIRPSLTYVVTLALDLDQAFTSPVVLTKRLRAYPIDAAPDEADERMDIGGSVLDRAANRPLVGATVRLRETGAEARTDADGRFVLRRAPRGRVTLVVTARGRRTPAQVTTEVPSSHYDLEV